MRVICGERSGCLVVWFSWFCCVRDCRWFAYSDTGAHSKTIDGAICVYKQPIGNSGFGGGEDNLFNRRRAQHRPDDADGDYSSVPRRRINSAYMLSMQFFLIFFCNEIR